MTVRDFIIRYKCYIILFLLVILLILGVFTSRQYILISKANRIAHNHLITKEGSRIPSTFANKPDTAPTTIQDVLIFKNADVEPNNISYKINLFENHKMTHDNNVVQITRTDSEFLNDTENKVPIMFPIEEIQDGNSMVNSVNNMVVMVPAGEAGNYKFMVGVIDKDMKFNTLHKFSANVDTNILVQFPSPINVTNQILFLGILKGNQKYVKISNIILNKENAVSVANISVPNGGSNGVKVGSSLSNEYKNDTPIYYKTIIDEKNTKMKFLNNENNDYFVELSRFDEEFMLDKSNKLPIVMIFDNLNLYKKENQTMNIDKPVNNIDNIYFKIPQSGKYKVMVGTVDKYGMNVYYKYNFDVQPNKNMVLVKLPNPINIENKKLFMGILKEDSKAVQISQIVFNFNGEIVN